MNDMGVIASADLGAMSDVICRVSALLSVNANETAKHLAEALESIYAQSLPPDQLVLVINGPTPTDHDAVIARYQTDPRIAACEIIRLPSPNRSRQCHQCWVCALHGRMVYPHHLRRREPLRSFGGATRLCGSASRR